MTPADLAGKAGEVLGHTLLAPRLTWASDNSFHDFSSVPAFSGAGLPVLARPYTFSDRLTLLMSFGTAPEAFRAAS